MRFTICSKSNLRASDRNRKVSLVWSKLGNSILDHLKSHEAQEPNFQQNKIARGCFCKVKSSKGEIGTQKVLYFFLNLPVLQYVAITVAIPCRRGPQSCRLELNWSKTQQASIALHWGSQEIGHASRVVPAPCFPAAYPKAAPPWPCWRTEADSQDFGGDEKKWKRNWMRSELSVFYHVLLFICFFHNQNISNLYRILCSIWREPSMDFVCVWLGMQNMQARHVSTLSLFYLIPWRLTCGLSLPSAFWAWVVWAHGFMPDAPKKSQPSKLGYFHEMWSICVKEVAIFCAEPSQMLTFCTSRKTPVVWHTTTLIAKDGCSSFCAKCFHSCASAYPRSWAFQPATFGHWMPICWQLGRRLFASNASTSDPTSGSRLAWRWFWVVLSKWLCPKRWMPKHV